MTGRRALVGLSLLCALAFSAFAASSASAATSGLTAVTCKEGGTLDFSRAHCAKADAVTPGTGKYGHFAVTEKTETIGSNAATKNETKEAESLVWHGISGGVILEITCSEVSSTGLIENLLVGEEHRITASNVVIVYRKCVIKKPAEKGCVVKGGEIKMNPLHGTSAVKGTEHTMNFVPEKEGNPFTVITFEKCTVLGLNKEYNLTGSTPTKIDGATLSAKIERNAESTLEFGGQKLGLTSAETIRARKVGGVEAAEPLSATTAPFTTGVAPPPPPKPGVTAVTCKEGGSIKDFSKAHCKESDRVANGTGSFSHFAVPAGTPTAITATNAATNSTTTEPVAPILHGISGGVVIEITCTTLSATGTFENSLVGEERRLTGSESIITYKGCIVNKPVGKLCVVKGGEIKTNSLKATSVGAGDGVVFTPTAAGGAFATIVLEECTVAGLNKAYELTGSIPAKFDGATLNVNIERNAESPLELGGQRAGLTSTGTIRAKKVGGAEAAEPLSATTAPFTVSS